MMQKCGKERNASILESLPLTWLYLQGPFDMGVITGIIAYKRERELGGSLNEHSVGLPCLVLVGLD